VWAVLVAHSKWRAEQAWTCSPAASSGVLPIIGPELGPSWLASALRSERCLAKWQKFGEGVALLSGSLSLQESTPSVSGQRQAKPLTSRLKYFIATTFITPPGRIFDWCRG
jgi:hypothetical protein